MHAAPAAAVVDAPAPTKLPTNDKSPNLLKIRHTSAHVMAMAVQRLFPGVQVTIGPWIDNGFYYDFDTGETKFTEEDLSKIKKEMERIIKARLPLRREEVTREEARRRIEAIGEPYKLEILDSIKVGRACCARVCACVLREWIEVSERRRAPQNACIMRMGVWMASGLTLTTPHPQIMPS